MSGSGGGGGGGGTEPSADCASLTKLTTVNSPVPAVVSTLKVGERLAVELDPAGSGRIEVRTASAEVAGSLTYTGISRLRKCIEDGWRFVAIVTDISGGAVTVEVRLR